MAEAVLLASLLATCQATSTFWHISDLHLDYLYAEGGDRSHWCHASNSSTTPGAGPAGDYRCDAPPPLVFSALEAMAKLEPLPDFIVWTGDSAPHWGAKDGLQPPDGSYIMNVTKRVFQRLDDLFPGVPVVPALGNHDSSPPDQFPVETEKDRSPVYYRELWKQGAFGDHIEEEGRETFQRCGFYTKVIDSFRFVVLNTNIYYGDDLAEGPDPCDQMDWFNSTLVRATEKVFVVAHVPPGVFERGGKEGFAINFDRPREYSNEINKRYVSIVTESSNAEKIVAHLYGHLHTDTFRLFLDSATKQFPRGCAFMAGSVTPVVWGLDGDVGTGVVGTNPSIRLFKYDGAEARLLDYTEYNLDIVEANKPATTTSATILTDGGPAKNRRKSLRGERSRRQLEVTEAEVEKSTTTSVSSTRMDHNEDFTLKADIIQTGSDPKVGTDRPSIEPEALDTTVEAVTSALSLTSPADLDPDTTQAESLTRQWKLLYVATEAFKVPDLSPQSMMGAVRSMVDGGVNGSVFQTYYLHNTAGHARPGCGEKCWRQHLCSITRQVETELRACLNSTGKEGFYYSPSPVRLVTTTTVEPTNDNDNLHLPYSTLRIEAVTGPPFTRGLDSPKVEPVPEVRLRLTPPTTVQGSAGTSAVSVVVALVGLVVVAVVASLGYKKYRDSRYRNQEFLLTDSVFRYDGYSQLDDD